MSETNDLELPEGFGAPSSSGVKFERWKLKEQAPLLTLRPLPAMKGLLQKREAGIFRKVHYGWSGKNPSDPTKNVFRPFLCVEERRNGMVVQECPACKYRAEYTKKQNELKTQEEKIASDVREAAKAKGVTDEQKILNAISKKLESLNGEKKAIVGWLKDHGVDGKWLFYAMNKSGAIGIAEIPYTLKKDFAALCSSLEGQNYPLSQTGGKEMAIQANGRIGLFFNFSRSGKNFDTSYKVEVNTVPFGNEGAMMRDFHKISNEQLRQALEVLPCLVQDVESLRLTVDKVQELVDHSRAVGGGCDPDVVDGIMGKKVSSFVVENKATVASNNAATDDLFDTPVAESKPAEAPKAEVKAENKVETKSEPAQVNMADASDDEFDAIFK